MSDVPRLTRGTVLQISFTVTVSEMCFLQHLRPQGHQQNNQQEGS